MTLLIDSIIMIIFASFPRGIVLPTWISFICILTDCGETEPQKDCFQIKVPRGDAEAVELLAGFPVPYGDEEGQGVACEEVWALGKVEP